MEVQMRNSFILYSSYEDILKELSKEEIGEVLMAIFAYQRTGEKPELSKGANIAFLFIKNQLDIDAEKWAKEVENRSKAGKKGMEKRWGKKSVTEDNSVISDITKITEYDNENEIVNEYEKENENEDVYENKVNPLLTFSKRMNGKVQDWINYKGNSFNPITTVNFINLIKEKLKIHTEDEIIDLIDLSINRQWKNIIWSKLEGENEGMKAFYDSFAL